MISLMSASSEENSENLQNRPTNETASHVLCFVSKKNRVNWFHRHYVFAYFHSDERFCLSEDF